MNTFALSSLATFLLVSKSTRAFESGWEFRQAQNCSSIMEIICDQDSPLPTNILCEAIQLAGLQDDLDTEEWTVFAPTDVAFEALPENIISSLLEDDTRGLIDLLAFHSVPGEIVKSTDLKCGTRMFMANEEFSVTVCEGSKIFQIGFANPVANYPEIVSADIEACNGIIHTLSEVMLFDEFNIDTNVTDEFNIDTNVTLTEWPSASPTDLVSEVPSEVLSGTPSDAISEAPSTNPSGAPSSGSSPKPSFVPTEGISELTSNSKAPSATPSVTPPEPCSITEIACDSEDFSYLCAGLRATGLDGLLDDYNGTSTVFAPSNAAFEKLGDAAIAFLLAPQNLEVLTHILSFHMVGDEVIFSQDLSCRELIEMGNGKDSRTVCRGESIFQKGKGNTPLEMPEIIEADIESCNGVIHVIDEVMLYEKGDELGLPPKDATVAPTTTPLLVQSSSPAPTNPATEEPPVASNPVPEEPGACKTVDELVCDTPEFSILCASLKKTGLPMDEGNWTVFAPNNEAFLELPPRYVEMITHNPGLMTRLLLFHTVEDQTLYKDDLPCVAGKNLVKMTNGKDSRTLCRDKKAGYPVPRYQKGKYNTDNDLPRFVQFDMHACNGVVHELDGVMLFSSI